MPTVKYSNLKVTPEINARLVTFVKKYVHKSQEHAAALLNTSQSTLSNVFIGKRPPSANLWNALITKYKMNQDWVINGTGPQIMKEVEDKKSLIKDIGALQVEITGLKRKMAIYEANQEHLFKVVERLSKRLDEANI